MTEPDEYYSFDDAEISGALAAARQPHEEVDLKAVNEIPLHQDPRLTILAQCISVTVGNRKVCLSLPLGIGRVCIPIPLNVPNGTAAAACLSICTTFGIPTGVCVRVTVAGVTVVRQCFGFGC